MTLLMVFLRLSLSAASNVLQKQAARYLHPFVIVAMTYVALTVLAIPFLNQVAFEQLSLGFWQQVFWSAVFDVAGWLFLVLSLSKTDLSVFGPLNAYKVVFSMLLAMLFLHEIPNMQGFLGVGLIVLGSFLLAENMHNQSLNFTQKLKLLFKDRGVQARFLSIGLFSIGTIFLKNAVVLAGAFHTLIFWCLIGLPLVLASNFFVIKTNLSTQLISTKPHVVQMLAIGLLVFVMQYVTLVLLSQMLVAYALALFQLGMVLQVFLGYQFFQERHIVRRLIACLVMMLGSITVLFN